MSFFVVVCAHPFKLSFHAGTVNIFVFPNLVQSEQSPSAHALSECRHTSSSSSSSSSSYICICTTLYTPIYRREPLYTGERHLIDRRQMQLKTVETSTFVVFYNFNKNEWVV